MKPRSREALVRLWHEQLGACVKCGACLAFCPLYQWTRREAASMRGKLALLQGWKVGLPISPGAVRAALEACTGCQSCRVHCPNGVDTTLAVLLGRILLPRGRVELLRDRLWAWVLPYPTGRRLWRWWAGALTWRDIVAAPLGRAECRPLAGKSATGPVSVEGSPTGAIVGVGGSAAPPLLRAAGSGGQKDVDSKVGEKPPQASGLEGSRSPGATDGRGVWVAGCETTLFAPWWEEVRSWLGDGGGGAGIRFVQEPCCGGWALEIPDLKSFARQATAWVRSLFELAPERVVVGDLRCLAVLRRINDLCEVRPEEEAMLGRVMDPFTWLLEREFRPPARGAGPVLLADPTAHWPGATLGRSARRLLLETGATTVVDCGVAGGGCDCRGGHPESGQGVGADPREAVEQRAMAAGADRVLTLCPTCPERARRLGRRFRWEYALTWLVQGGVER